MKANRAPSEGVGRAIIVLRGQRVMLDADLASLYGVTTGALNQSVKRNRGRFPADFVFQLTAKEKAEVITNCDNLRRLRYSPVPPWAFTEHGAVMLASVLNSRRAWEMSVHVVRAFIALREFALSYRALADKIDRMEQGYDASFRDVFDAIRLLMRPPDPPKRRIGFRPDSEEPVGRG